MLETLHVKNLAIIDEAEVNFRRGLNILTGETGAGKSVIIDSVNLALGAKGGRELVRSEAEYGLVELSFFTEEEKELERLKDLEVFDEDGVVILSRRITDGRNNCKINGETVPLTQLKNVGEIFIDLHGQHEHQSLLYRKNHLQLLDLYAKESVGNLLISYEKEYKSYLSLRREFEEMNLDEAALLKEKSLLEFEIREIEQANLKEGEDEELETQYRKLANMQKIAEALDLCYQLTSPEQSGGGLSRAARELSSVISYDDALLDMSSQLEEIDSLLTDFRHDLNSYISDNSYDPQAFLEVEQRLNDINHLKNKYGKNISAILEYARKEEERLEELSDYDSSKAKKEQALREKEEILDKLAADLSKAREAAAKDLSEKITQSLSELNFNGAKFWVSIEIQGDFGPKGIDSVEFLISTNTGEDLKPLDKVASGGELSRIMLALISVCAENDQIETLIFDEIDTGISGRTAQMVAEKLCLIAKSHQVICITHLPQIAAMADTHFVIEKSVEGEKTISNIRRLDEAESEAELARLLGGAKITDAVLENARELKAFARALKK